MKHFQNRSGQGKLNEFNSNTEVKCFTITFCNCVHVLQEGAGHRF